MKTGYLVCFVCFIFFSCATGNVEEEIYPADIQITEYQLPVGCTWKHVETEEVVIINSKEELAVYTDTAVFPDIDFSTHSLLYVYGSFDGAPYTIQKSSCTLQLAAKNKYSLNVDVKMLNIAEIRDWGIIYLTGKMDKKSIIELNITPVYETSECSVWKCTVRADINDPSDTVIIELSFYPSIHIACTRTIPNVQLPNIHLLLARGVTDYHIEDGDKLFWHAPRPDDEKSKYFWQIIKLSENEIRLNYAAPLPAYGNIIGAYHFICQTNFKEI